ncbi:MAG TPA: LysR family transcriptional regulator [Vineibacter sp.]|nr:LysR family transcriptional regulator [Vineibacter sp.]
MTRLPNLRGLEAFVTVGECGSIRAAASLLNLTPSAVSRRIAALEYDLETSLIVRTPQGISLTREGRALHRVVTKAFGAIAQHVGGQRVTHRITIKAPHSFASRWLARHMPRLRERYPAVTFTIETSPRIERLAAGAIAIRFGFGDWRDGIATKLVDVPMQAVAGPAYRDHGRLTRADLQATRVLVVSGTERVWSRWLTANRLGTLAGLETLSFDNTDVAIRAAAAGTGITIAGAGIAEPAGGRLVPFPATLADVGAGYYLVVPRGQRNTLPVRDLAPWLRAQFR